MTTYPIEIRRYREPKPEYGLDYLSSLIDLQREYVKYLLDNDMITKYLNLDIRVRHLFRQKALNKLSEEIIRLEVEIKTIMRNQ